MLYDFAHPYYADADRIFRKMGNMHQKVFNKGRINSSPTYRGGR